MRKSKFTEAQIIAILKQAEGGAKVSGRCQGSCSLKRSLKLPRSPALVQG